jgi:hypothetical protein
MGLTMSEHRTTKVAAESLIAQITSQCKIATLRSENQYKNNIFKVHNWKCFRRQLKVYRLIPKKHTSKSCETIPLSLTKRSQFTFEMLSRIIVKGTHTTPIHRYVDDLTFTFIPGDETPCLVDVSYISNVWHIAILVWSGGCSVVWGMGIE